MSKDSYVLSPSLREYSRDVMHVIVKLIILTVHIEEDIPLCTADNPGDIGILCLHSFR